MLVKEHDDGPTRLESLRDSIARVLISTRIPVLMCIGRFIRPVWIQKDIDSFASMFLEGVKRMEELHTRLRELSPNYAKFSPEKPDYVISSSLDTFHRLAGESLTMMTVIFENYAVNATTFTAIIDTFRELPFEFVRRGLLSPETCEFHDPENNTQLVIALTTEALTKNLVRATPGRWDFDTLLAEIRSL